MLLKAWAKPLISRDFKTLSQLTLLPAMFSTVTWNLPPLA